MFPIAAIDYVDNCCQDKVFLLKNEKIFPEQIFLVTSDIEWKFGGDTSGIKQYWLLCFKKNVRYLRRSFKIVSC